MVAATSAPTTNLTSKAQLMEIIRTGRTFLLALEQFAATAKFQDDGEDDGADILVTDNSKDVCAGSTTSSVVSSVINDLQKTVIGTQESFNSSSNVGGGGGDSVSSSSRLQSGTSNDEDGKTEATANTGGDTAGSSSGGADNVSLLTGVATTNTNATAGGGGSGRGGGGVSLLTGTGAVSATASGTTNRVEEEHNETDDFPDLQFGPLGVFGGPTGKKQRQRNPGDSASSAASGGGGTSTPTPPPVEPFSMSFLDDEDDDDVGGGGNAPTTNLESHSSSSSAGKQWISFPKSDNEHLSFPSATAGGLGLGLGVPGSSSSRDSSAAITDYNVPIPKPPPEYQPSEFPHPTGMNSNAPEFRVPASFTSSQQQPSPASVTAPGIGGSAQGAPTINVAKMSLAEIQAIQRKNAAANSAGKTYGRTSGAKKKSSSSAGVGAPAGGELEDPTQPKRHTGFLRMRGLPFRASKVDITKFFERFNVVFDSIVLTYYNDGRATGEAFVGFQTPNDAKRAMGALNRTIMGNRYIELFISTKEEHGVAWARFTYR